MRRWGSRGGRNGPLAVGMAGWVVIVIGLNGGGGRGTAADAETVATALAVIRQVDREGAGNTAAAAAWERLVAAGRPALLPILQAVRDDQPRAANWLRPAIDAIVENELRAGRPLPLAELEAFVRDRRHAARGRYWAYELLAQQDLHAPSRLLPQAIDDPSLELRRAAIAYALEQLERQNGPARRAELERLFAAARDRDQVDLLAKKVAEAGGQADVTRHFAFLTQLELAGPFDAPNSKGYELVYPPEQQPRAAGPFRGKDGATLRWRTVQTADRYGLFDFNKILGKHKDAVVLARAILAAESATPCEVRVTSPTSVKIYLNGQLLFGRDEYHHGAYFDAHVGRGGLRAGDNVLLVKVCQNNQQESWAQSWQLQVRVCDATGGALPGVMQRVTDPAGGSRLVPLGQRPLSSEK